ncbi:high mobility group protein B3-like [Medicago truncatula]|uniref:high mobility group protein B3-like n=1 Tax=Medicago truncatula TaxID=3880 RepID=UPI0019687EB2|nr:high mobility group protein B3-like [Medicago truncatula]
MGQKLYNKSKERKAKKIKVEKDHDMLENPPSSFSLLWDKFGKNFKEVNQNSGVNKMAVKAWNSMSNEDKQHYLDKAAKRKAKHEKLKKKGTMFIPNLIDFVLLNSISNNILIV